MRVGRWEAAYVVLLEVFSVLVWLVMQHAGGRVCGFGFGELTQWFHDATEGLFGCRRGLREFRLRARAERHATAIDVRFTDGCKVAKLFGKLSRSE